MCFLIPYSKWRRADLNLGSAYTESQNKIALDKQLNISIIFMAVCANTKSEEKEFYCFAGNDLTLLPRRKNE